MKNTRRTGDVGESVACAFLTSRGFEILERNYYKPWGEIDIIAKKGGILHFIEVKSVSREIPDGISRETDDYRPEELVHTKKLQRIARTLAFYLEEKLHQDVDFQIDVVAVFLNTKTHRAQCRLTENVT